MGFGSFVKSFAGPISDLVGAAAGIAGAVTPTEMNYDDQAIQRRVMDAKAAGIHPLYAMGQSGGYAAPMTGSGLGEGLEAVSGAIGSTARREDRKQRYAQGQPAAAASLAHTQAQTDYIRQQTEHIKLKMMEQRVNQTGFGREPLVTTEPLDKGFIKDPTGRLSMFRDFKGKWHRVNRSLAPSEILEQEYGELGGEGQAVGRAAREMYGYGGAGRFEGPSMRDMYDFIRNR